MLEPTGKPPRRRRSRAASSKRRQGPRVRSGGAGADTAAIKLVGSETLHAFLGTLTA